LIDPVSIQANIGDIGHGGMTLVYSPVVATPLVSVSVDLDSIECYFRIHALGSAPSGEVRHAILHRALPRFLDLFAEFDLAATFFAVGMDVEEDTEGQALLAQAVRSGHEVANHSYRHRYDLSRLSSSAIAEEIDRAHAVLSEACQKSPIGFRAPGYEISGAVLEILNQRGYRYDSSTFPAIPYYLAKALVMAGMRLVGRTSGSILGSPRVLMAPTRPYHPSTKMPYSCGELSILELPITVTPWLRLPVIGTSLVMSPGWLRRALVSSALKTPHFNLELHGIDLADAELDQVPTVLVAKQPDLRLPMARKLAALRSTLSEARDQGARFVTLATAATLF
jgi:hypothetical protein